MYGYEHINAVRTIYFEHEQVNSLLYNALSGVISNRSIPEHVRSKNYVGKIIGSAESNFYFLILMHLPSNAIVVLEDFDILFGKTQPLDKLFSFPISIIKSKDPAPQEFYVMKTLCLACPASGLNVVARVKAEKINQAASELRVQRELLDALSEYDEEVLKAKDVLLQLMSQMNVLKASSLDNMSFSTEVDNSGAPVENRYNLAFWIEKIYSMLNAKGRVVQDASEFKSSKKALKYCDTDYSIAILHDKNKPNVKRILLQDQNCGFLIDYTSPADYKIWCADVTHIDPGLGSYKKTTSITELLTVVNNQEDCMNFDFLVDHAAVIVQESELEYISGPLVYCIFLDIEGAIDAIGIDD